MLDREKGLELQGYLANAQHNRNRGPRWHSEQGPSPAFTVGGPPVLLLQKSHRITDPQQLSWKYQYT